MNSVFTDENDIQGMREAGRLASEVLDHVAPLYSLASALASWIAFAISICVTCKKPYQRHSITNRPDIHPFQLRFAPRVNDVICHGIPGDKILKSGDVVNLDITVITPAGYFGDTSRMFMVGEPSVLAKRLTKLPLNACGWASLKSSLARASATSGM
jgi:methionyl aminopeptidase